MPRRRCTPLISIPAWPAPSGRSQSDRILCELAVLLVLEGTIWAAFCIQWVAPGDIIFGDIVESAESSPKRRMRFLQKLLKRFSEENLFARLWRKIAALFPHSKDTELCRLPGGCGRNSHNRGVLDSLARKAEVQSTLTLFFRQKSRERCKGTVNKRNSPGNLDF